MAQEMGRLNEFLDEVCEYMRSWHSYADATTGSVSLDKICNEPHGNFKKKLKLFYRAFDPMHKEWLTHFFLSFPLDRDSVKILLDCHYFKILSKTKDIFICLLYICSFTYSVLQFCERNRLDNMMIEIRTILRNEFLRNQRRFICEGGWIGLNRFCKSSLPLLLKFIRLCYCERAILHTFVYTTQNFNDFGLHGREMLDLLMNYLDPFEIAVREAFSKEINQDLMSKGEVDAEFLELRRDMANGPLQNYLRRDREAIALDPTSPLSQI